MSEAREARTAKFKAKAKRRAEERAALGPRYVSVRAARRALIPVPGAFGNVTDRDRLRELT